MNENCKQLWKILESLKEKRYSYASALKEAKEEGDFSKMQYLMEGLKSAIAEVKGLLQLEVLKLEQQYSQMVKTLEHYEISTAGMPTLESIKKALTNNLEVARKTQQLEKPTLLLIPATSRQSKVKVIDEHKVEGQEDDTYTHRFEDNDLWNGGEPDEVEADNKWRVEIVEGIQDVPQDKEIYNGKRNNYEMLKLWVEKLNNKGLDVINDADAYLTLMMRSLVDGKPVDSKTYTVLNGKSLTKGSLVALGLWNVDGVYLLRDDSGHVNDHLRLRGSVGVDVQ